MNCVRFCFGAVCDFCLCMKYFGNRWTDLRQIHMEDVIDPLLRHVWMSRSVVKGQGHHGTKTAFFGAVACVRFMFGKTSLSLIRLILFVTCFRIQAAAVIMRRWRKNSTVHNKLSPLIVQADRLCSTLMVFVEYYRYSLQINVISYKLLGHYFSAVCRCLMLQIYIYCNDVRSWFPDLQVNKHIECK